MRVDPGNAISPGLNPSLMASELLTSVSSVILVECYPFKQGDCLIISPWLSVFGTKIRTSQLTLHLVSDNLGGEYPVVTDTN